ncbi:MAG TPA: hypothetical protein P5316_01645 [Phycisphaerae bacterium]|nr:hypothetical protein [Phycisphaerae bacterium]
MVRAKIRLIAVVAVLGMAITVPAAEHWRGAGWGGDGTSWHDVLNWDDSIPSATTWDVNKTGEQGTPGNHNIRITANGTCGSGTIYDQPGYTVNMTLEENRTMTNSGALNYYAAGLFTVKTGAFYDMRNGQLGLESSGLTVAIEPNGRLFCSTLRHNNGAKVDVYGLLEAWTVSRIAADSGYRLAVYGGGEFLVHDSVPTGGWSKDGKVTQYLCSTVTLAGDHTAPADYLTKVQAGEPGTWDVSYSGGWTTIRLIESDDCDFTATPSDIESKPGAGAASSQAHEITVTNTRVGGSDVNYTITVLDRNLVPIDVADVPWLSIDKLSGGPIAPNGTDIVTATVDYTKLEVGLNTVTLRFKCDCDSCEVHDVKITAPFIMVYNGDVDPDAPDSAGAGLQFRLVDGQKQGFVLTSAPDTVDGFAWELPDAAGDPADPFAGPRTRWRTTPFQNLGGTTGATIVGRIRVGTAVAPNSANLLIDHTSYACGLHWRGNGSAVDPVWRPGVLQELERNGGVHDPPNPPSTVQLGPEEYDAPYNVAYHVFRMTGVEIVGDGGAKERVVKIYVDERPNPVITVSGTKSAGADGLGFGATNALSWQHVWFDWITGTNAGAFAPGEEVSCIGRSLYLGGRYDPCNEVFADADGDGDVDQADFAVFQLCYTGMDGGVLTDPDYCQCFDRRNNDNSPGQDNDVDSFDLAAFEDCASGPGVPADPECDD